MVVSTVIDRTPDMKLLVGTAIALLIILGIAVFLYIFRKKPRAPEGGSQFVIAETGKAVRRSRRSHKSPSRWSPDDLGSPTGYSNHVSAVKAELSDAKVTPAKRVIKAVVKEETTVEVTPIAAKRGPSRLSKTPKEKPVSQPLSPRRTRRAGQTPAK